jgi:hypothetical protein
MKINLKKCKRCYFFCVLNLLRKGKKAIENICFQLEKKVLLDFDKSADAKDYDRMKVKYFESNGLK